MKFQIFSIFVILIGLGICSTSCISNKKIYYLQNKEFSKKKDIEKDTATYFSTYKRFQHRIQINDNLQIFVRSKSENAALFFNKTDISSQSTLGGDFSLYLNGYVVNDSGMVEIPNLSKFKVVGLTIPEARELITKEAKKYINDPIVQIALTGINFSVLGEVQRPNRLRIFQHQVTIFEAIAEAGDLKEIANRRKVKLVRQYHDGVRVHIVDLTDRNIINSPYYFIQPNDVIYVRPMKIRELGVGTTGFSTIQAVITVLSVVGLIYTLTR
jgi:polysaccharide export outer membrane protein